MFSLSEIDNIATAALGELPRLIAELGMQARPHEAIDRFRRLVDSACSGKLELDISSLVDALRWMRDVLSERLNKPTFPSEHRNVFQIYVDALDRLQIVLETGNFAMRLKRWAGREVYGDEDSLVIKGHLTRLVDEAIEKPELLDVYMLEWLLSPASQRAHVFFSFLGQRDERLLFRERVEVLGQKSYGAKAFSAYWGGWANRNWQVAKNRLDHLARSNAVAGEAIILATVRLGADQAAIDRVKTQIQAGRVDPEYAASELSSSRFFMEGLTEDLFEELLQAVTGETFEHGIAAVSMLLMWNHFAKPLRGNIADFAWECLEHSSSLTALPDSWPWRFDRLAAKLAQDNPELGFRLLDRLIQRNGKDRHHWNPLEFYGRAQFWHVLYTKDRSHFIRLLLDAIQTHAPVRYDLSWCLRERLDQEADRDLLLSFAGGDIQYARIVASWLTSAKPGFWPIALELVREYPHDEELLSNLTEGLEQQGIFIEGPYSEFYKSLQQKIEPLLKEPSTPPEARVWLRDVLGRLEREIPRQIIWEYDLNVEDLHRHIQDKNSAQRLWAIGRVLKYASWDDIRRLLTVEDIEEALPQVDLPEKRRQMLEQAIEVWRHGN